MNFKQTWYHLTTSMAWILGKSETDDGKEDKFMPIQLYNGKKITQRMIDQQKC